MGKMTFSAEVDQEEVIESVTDSLDQDELASFIQSIDGKVGDWDFTKRMYAFFRNEMKRNAEDGGETIEAIDAEIDGAATPSEEGDDDDDDDLEDDAEDDDEDDDVEEDEEAEEEGEKNSPSGRSDRKMGEWG